MKIAPYNHEEKYKIENLVDKSYENLKELGALDNNGKDNTRKNSRI